MKKVLCLFCICLILSSCSEKKQKSFVCTIEYEQSSTEAIYYYNEDNEVESVMMKLTQVFSDEIVASRTKDEILQDLKSSFASTVGVNTQVEVNFDEVLKRADVELVWDVEEMNERELRYLNLYDTKNIEKLTKQLKALGLKCKKVN